MSFSRDVLTPNLVFFFFFFFFWHLVYGQNHQKFFSGKGCGVETEILTVEVDHSVDLSTYDGSECLFLLQRNLTYGIGIQGIVPGVTPIEPRA